ALRQLGAEVEGDALPLRVRGPLRGGQVRLSTEVSSQFATALVLVVDRVNGLRVKVEGRSSFSYVSLTAHVLRHFRDPFLVEPDFGSAAAFAVGAAVTRGDLLLEGLGLSSPQPDARIVPFLNRAGARVSGTEHGIRVQGGSLRGIRANLSNCPDLAPLLGVLGALAEGETIVEGAPQLAHKESDRIATTVDLVRAVGGEAIPLPDGFRIVGGRPLRPARVAASGDHRIAMAAGLLALSVPGLTLVGSEAVAKSYPGFFGDLQRLTA
ncbi:MAG: 3-phosphoshikimate 1-carboxyvinyltransferase, partial [Planctomycetota bacterium]